MAVIQADDIADLVALTLRDLGRMKWTEIATDLQEYIALPNILRKERVRFQSGYGIQFQVMVAHSGAAKSTGLYAVDSVNVGDVMVNADIPWRHSTTNYAIERREVAMNRDPARIVELIKVRRADAMISLAAHLEQMFWSLPGASSDDMFGLPYWCVTNASNGFTGGNPSGFSAGAAGLDADVYSRWKNYSYNYTNITKTDLIRGWREAATKTNFMSPVPIPSYNTGNRYGYYCNYDVIGPLEEAVEAQNDNLGNNIASKDGTVNFRQVPVKYVPYLDADATDPVYGINWGVFKPVFLSGEYMNETTVPRAANQHTTTQVHVDLTANYECRDRRRLFVLYK